MIPDLNMAVLQIPNSLENIYPYFQRYTVYDQTCDREREAALRISEESTGEHHVQIPVAALDATVETQS